MDTREEIIKYMVSEIDFSDLSKEELIGVCKSLLRSLKSTEHAFDAMYDNCGDLETMYRELHDLYDESKEYEYAYLRGFSLPFGFRIVRLKNRKNDD